MDRKLARRMTRDGDRRPPPSSPTMFAPPCSIRPPCACRTGRCVATLVWGVPFSAVEALPMAQRQRWTLIPSIVYGVTFGVLAGGLIIWGFQGGDRWQDQ